MISFSASRLLFVIIAAHIVVDSSQQQNGGGSGSCSVCGDGKIVMAPPDTIFRFPGQQDILCSQLQFIGYQGFIPKEQCDFIPNLISFVCQCQEGEIASELLSAEKGCPIVPRGGCAICGPNKCVSIRDNLISLTDEPAIACSSLELAGLNGDIPLNLCTALSKTVNEECHCSGGDDDLIDTTPSLDVVDLSRIDPRFTTLLIAFTSIGDEDLIDMLKNPIGSFTLFAPTNDAFAALPDELLGCLLQNDNSLLLKNILLYHILNQAIPYSDLLNHRFLTTMNGDVISVSTNDDHIVRINNAILLQTDEATNGILHVVDTVLIPPEIDINGFLQTNCIVSKEQQQGQVQLQQPASSSLLIYTPAPTATVDIGGETIFNLAGKKGNKKQKN